VKDSVVCVWGRQNKCRQGVDWNFHKIARWRLRHLALRPNIFLHGIDCRCYFWIIKNGICVFLVKRISMKFTLRLCTTSGSSRAANKTGYLTNFLRSRHLTSWDSEPVSNRLLLSYSDSDVRNQCKVVEVFYITVVVRYVCFIFKNLLSKLLCKITKFHVNKSSSVSKMGSHLRPEFLETKVETHQNRNQVTFTCSAVISQGYLEVLDIPVMSAANASFSANFCVCQVIPTLRENFFYAVQQTNASVKDEF